MAHKCSGNGWIQTKNTLKAHFTLGWKYKEQQIVVKLKCSLKESYLGRWRFSLDRRRSCGSGLLAIESWGSRKRFPSVKSFDWWPFSNLALLGNLQLGRVSYLTDSVLSKRFIHWWHFSSVNKQKKFWILLICSSSIGFCFILATSLAIDMKISKVKLLPWQLV